MVIKKLTTHFQTNGCLQEFTLRDTDLVIHGDLISEELYYSKCNGNYSNCDTRFRGEYGTYAWRVGTFLDNLLDCNVRPIIIFHGGLAKKNLDVKLEKKNTQISDIPKLCARKRVRLPPILLKEVFKVVANRRKNVKCLQTVLNSHFEIASVARALKCPVLSNHSEFFIYDNIEFIIYSTLKVDKATSLSDRDGMRLNCSIFKFSYVLAKYPKMKRSLLPFISIFLGLHSMSIFKRFLDKQFDGPHKDRVFTWLSDQDTTDTVISAVLCEYPENEHQAIITMIESMINQYSVSSFGMLSSLGYSTAEVADMVKEIPCEAYKFRNRNALEIVEQEIPPGNVLLKIDEVLNNLESDIPWFLIKYKAAELPSYFLDVLMQKPYICQVQAEDLSRSTCVNVSLKIIQVIFKLLSAGTNIDSILTYYTREGSEFKEHKLECRDLDCPPLSRLIDLSDAERHQILLDTLGVSKEFLEEFPPEWRLYLGTIKYWMREADQDFATKYHVYSVIFVMLFRVIKGGLRNKFDQTFKDARIRYPSLTMSVEDACNRVDKSDSRKAESIFKEYFKVKNSTNIDVKVLHAFESLQNALKHSMNLNALLNDPYLNMNIADLYHSGVMMYNFYTTLRMHDDADTYVNNVLGNAPTVLRLFRLISRRIYTA